jgi:hypothetical protein
MPLYSIRRDVPGATREDVDASAFRAVVCAYEYEGLRWIRSFWDEHKEQILCLYEALSPEQLEDHARRSRIPCDEVREVEELTPKMYVGSEPVAATN